VPIAIRAAETRLPGPVQRVLRELKAPGGTRSKTESAVPLLRRIERDGVVYLPEVGRARTPLRAVVSFLVPLGFVGVVFTAVAWGLGQPEWFLALLGTSVGCIAVAIALALVDGAVSRQRRRGAETFGLVLTADALVLWGPRDCRVVPREAVIRLVAERRGGRSGGFRECVDVQAKSGPERWIVHPRSSPALRQALGRWQRDERPWVVEEQLGPPRPAPRPPG
jgi:hypothetical protein